MSASILYIHGLNSAPSSHKASVLSHAMARLGLADQLHVPALHHHPRNAMEQLHAAIAQLREPLLVGSSLGGYYATYLAERYGLRALLINPAVLPHNRFDGYLGEQTNHYTGERWQLTLDHVQALRELEVAALTAPERYQVWLQTGDETLDYRDAERYYRAASLIIEPGGDHGFQGFAARLPQLFDFAGIGAQQWRDLDFSDL